jgi:type 1 fimbriae regulatory protein FimB/type 1 fimbriae regulatory protein FimE
MPSNNLRTVRLAAQDGERLLRAAPGRRSNAQSGREREYLTPAEVEQLVAAAKKRGRHGLRDALAILMAYRHALRVSELVDLRWSQIDWTTTRITIHRRKGSIDGVAHPLLKDEVRMLKMVQQIQPAGTPYIFMGERGGVSTGWFQKLLARVGSECGLPLVHPHMLRHSAGFALADKGRDLREIQLHLGHKAIQHTTRYVELRPGRLDRISD